MRTLYLTTMIFCHILVSSFILYSGLASASPLAEQPSKPSAVVEPPKHVVAAVAAAPVAAATKPQEAPVQPPQYAATAVVAEAKDSVSAKSSVIAEAPKSAVAAAVVVPEAAAPKEEKQQQQPQKYIDQQQQFVPKVNKEESPVVAISSAKQEQPALPVQSPVAPFEQNRPELKVIPEVKSVVVEPTKPKVYESPKPSVLEQIPSLSDSVQEKLVASQPEPQAVPVKQPVIEASKVVPVPVAAPVAAAPVQAAPEPAANKPAHSSPPVVKGGLGPLHLLAATLCSYQPNKPVSDETLTYLYNQRNVQRKNLFQFMSLKFTNLDKLTAHLNAGSGDVVKAVDSGESSLVRSHGWPVVGNCTAHYLKLMAEAAWCDCAEEPQCLRDVADAKAVQQSQPRLARRSADSEQVAPMEKSSSVMSKLMYVGDVKEAPLVESAQKTPVQPATLASTRQCRRNALRLAKALFNHLAENQTQVSESWPKLRAELAQDECARKRMIDIVAALSTFRGESTQVHRDNIEFAFAMDDLRGKVLENEVNTPLTFDKQVIEVEQFLQQSVRLMLANIDPKRAKLTSMRYRSLHAPVSADDQCIELHQRLLAKNYPDECNPNQYGPLPDVLRMAALSLDLWSIEQDLSKYQSASQSAAPKQEDVNECIANLVAN